MPATDAERALDRRMDELAAMGYSVEVERMAAPGGWFGTGWCWRVRLKRDGVAYPSTESGGDTAEQALENAVDKARRFGAL